MIIPISEHRPGHVNGDKTAIRAVISQSAQMRQLIADTVRAAASSATVLLTGESGTGKELFARIVHENSQRRNKNYVNVNCAALPSNLIESELFGHEKGAFTDAIQQRVGRFEFADQGTLLLDEVTEIPLTTQAKLLRALEENEIQRVGSNSSIKTDIRIVATSNRDLMEQVQQGEFRLDLYHRLNVIEIHIPALRERAIDIPLLTTHFVEAFKFENSVPIQGLTKSAMRLLCSYHWPGNIRELRNAVHRACVLTTRPLIDEDCFSQCRKPAKQPNIESIPDAWLEMKLSEIERRVIIAALSRYGSKRAAADNLGVTSRTLSNKLKVYSELSVSDKKAA